jgi:hypothetical protein
VWRYGNKHQQEKDKKKQKIGRNRDSKQTLQDQCLVMSAKVAL